MNIFMTGATGFLGSTLVKELVERMHHVYILVRNPKKVESLLDRIDSSKRNQIHVIQGELSQEDLNISPYVLQGLIGKIDAIYHSAAFLSFDESKRNEVFDINVKGTKNVFDLAKFLGVKKVIYVSTAYTLGSRTIGTETLYPLDSSSFINSYEESKCHAEHLVMSYMDCFDVIIMRPSIIIGDSNTGEADTSFGLYGIIRTIELLKKKAEKGQAKQTEAYRLLMDKDTVSNLIPVNVVTNVLVQGLMFGENGRIYNITNSNALTNEEILEAITTGINFSFVKIIPYIEKESLTDYEKKINQALEVFKEYLGRSIIFENNNTQKLLENTSGCNLNIDKEMLIRIVRGFGKRRMELIRT